MNRQDFVSVSARHVLARHGLDSFEALWALKLDAVDAPNTQRGGWSSVYRLDLEDGNGQVQGFYLKRQDNHLTRSLRHPFGEPTFAREFRAIQEYARLGIPALEAAFFAQRAVPGHQQAVLLTRALDDYAALDEWFVRWDSLSRTEKNRLVLAAAALVRALHAAGKMHNCLYPKHVFLKLGAEGAGARLIDLEKTRDAWLGDKDRINDLATLHRRSVEPSRTQRLRFFLAYRGKRRLEADERALISRIQARQSQKDARS